MKLARQHHGVASVTVWADSIVVLMDLIGVKKRALNGNPSASALMRSFHKLVQWEMAGNLDALDHAYVWNDSVLLLARVDDRPEAYERAIRAADGLKRKVDVIAPNYAIAVKGRTFPSNVRLDGTRVTVIEASSYALANCFEIEAAAKREKLHSTWYIDVRIARKVRAAKALNWIEVPLLPGGKRRRVYLHDGHLWSVLASRR
jgi:hypothetical protein